MSGDGSDIEMTHCPTRFGVDSGIDTMKSVIEIASGGGDVIIVAESDDKPDAHHRGGKKSAATGDAKKHAVCIGTPRCAFTQRV